MANSKKLKVLAIDPGTREMGVALLEDGALIYHGVKTIRRKKSPQMQFAGSDPNDANDDRFR